MRIRWIQMGLLAVAFLPCARASAQSLPDTDGDGIPDLYDNCPYTANPDQKDRGGVGSGSAPDGIGDACQCGDVTNDGFVNVADVTVLKRTLAGLTPYAAGIQTLPGYLKCDVNADSSCDTADATIINRASVGLSPGIKQGCYAAIPHTGGGLGNGQPTPCVPATQPEVPLAEGWLGGDSGASVLMPDGSSVWVFADSFIGQAGATTRAGSTLVHNSIGISACNVTSWGAMDHYWTLMANGTTTTTSSFFTPYDISRSNNIFDWAVTPFYSGSNLYVLLQRWQYTPGQGLGFTLTGVDLAIVSNNSTVWTNPAFWTQQIVPVTSSTDAYPNAAAVIDGSYVYIYTSLIGSQYPSKPITVVRAPLNSLGSIASNLQYLSKASQSGYWQDPTKQVWNPLTDGWEGDALQVMPAGDAQISVAYHPSQQEWVAVYLPPLTSSSILARTAQAFPPAPGGTVSQGYLGPWSDPATPIYPVPEMQPGTSVYDPNAFCYSAVEHIEWATNNNIVVTYDCNDSTATIYSDMELYHPVTVPIPISSLPPPPNP